MSKRKSATFRCPDELWEKIEPLIPARPNTHRFGGGRPRVPDRQCMDGIIFVLRTGCQWKALDETKICSASTAHARFQEWVQAGVFLEFWKAGLMEYDALKGIDWEWLAMDGAMTKAPLAGGKVGKNPTDRGKMGAKRSLLSEAAGVPLGLAIEGANRQDMKLVRETLHSIPVERPKPTSQALQNLCLDKGYDYDEVRETVRAFGFTAHIRARGEEAQKIKREAGFKARRWVVERTHSWMNRFRRILIRWEKQADNYLGLLHFVCGTIAFQQAGLFG